MTWQWTLSPRIAGKALLRANDNELWNPLKATHFLTQLHIRHSRWKGKKTKNMS
jgi:hypothetical protein